MISKWRECFSIGVEPPRFVLETTSGLMRFYPIFLKASLLLQRFVQ